MTTPAAWALIMIILSDAGPAIAYIPGYGTATACEAASAEIKARAKATEDAVTTLVWCVPGPQRQDGRQP